MHHRRRRVARFLQVLLVVGLLAACTPVAESGPESGPGAGGEPLAADALAGLSVTVHQDETCGCCGGWVDHLASLGASVEVTYPADLDAFKADAGVPASAASCHTATVGGYAVEGHVPVQALLDLLAQQPAVAGIALPGMPPGSPGMPGDPAGPFEVVTFASGELAPFGSY